jgi:DNA-binding transcriptional MerR regulator
MLKIGDFSKLSRISIRMLRHYDDLGLLIPESIDSETGYRYYSASQLPRAARIGALKQMGFSLAVIGEILETHRDADALKQYLRVKQAEIREQSEKLGMHAQMIESAMKSIGKEGNFMDYSVALKEIPKRYVASLRQVIPTYGDENLLWSKMAQETGKKLSMANPCYSMAIFHDQTYREHDVDVEIQISVEGQHEDTENVCFKTVEPLTVASSTYQGSYDQITPVNLAVAKWVQENGYDFEGSMFCIYHVSPAQTQNPDEWVTEVCYPVQKNK